MLRCNIAIPGDQTGAANIDLLTVMWLKNEEEIVNSAGRTDIENELRYNTGESETRYITQLFLRSFQTSDIGIYQCVYTDLDTDRELVYSTPFRLDSGKYSISYNVLFYKISITDSATVVLEAVSPVDMILDPPEKLVIEVESSGGYFRHAWYKNNEEIFPNGDRQFTQDNPQKFSEFFQLFVEDPTDTTHHGIYRVDLIDDDNSATVLESQEFTVTPSGKFTTS